MSLLRLTVTQAATSKDAEYDDAFASPPCPDCGEIEDGGVFRVLCTYDNTTLMSVFVPRSAVEPAMNQAMQLYDVLHSRIDAASVEYNHSHEFSVRRDDS